MYFFLSPIGAKTGLVAYLSIAEKGREEGG
jgi:hypothetical protein